MATLTAKQQECLNAIQDWLNASGRSELDFDVNHALVLRHYLPKDLTFSAASVKALIRKGCLQVVRETENVTGGGKRNPYTREWSSTKTVSKVTVRINHR
jgi:hypothetical protein